MATTPEGPTSVLDEWLTHAVQDPNPFLQFTAIRLSEDPPCSAEIEDYLARLITNELFDQTLLADLAHALGWGRTAADIIARRIPKLTQIRRGDFGEALANDILGHFEAFSIPIRKLRYKVTADQTLTGTDALALKTLPDGSISEVCFVESKFRGSRDIYAGVEACKQLLRDTTAAIPDILTFVAARLHDTGHLSYDSFLEYLASRADTREMETLRIALCCELAGWDEATLLNIDEANLQPLRLSVSICLISGLTAIVDRVFAQLGLTASDEDD